MKNAQNSDYTDRVIDHYCTKWGSDYDIFLWEKGPIEKLPFNFRVLEFAPRNGRDMWTYATAGMSYPEGSQPIELHIHSSQQDSNLIEILTAVVFYHNNTSSLGLNHTVNFGKPWQSNSKCKFGFISLPYLDGPDLEILHLGEFDIKFFWLIPVTEAEIRFKQKLGVNALEQLFETHGLNYLDPQRSSLV